MYMVKLTLASKMMVRIYPRQIYRKPRANIGTGTDSIGCSLNEKNFPFVEKF